MNYRTEKDLLGTMQIPAEALHGIHTARAIENFPISQRPVCGRFIAAYGAAGTSTKFESLISPQKVIMLGNADNPEEK